MLSASSNQNKLPFISSEILNLNMSFSSHARFSMYKVYIYNVYRYVYRHGIYNVTIRMCSLNTIR